MDEQHYWPIAEHDIEIQNPITDRKLRLLDDYCDIRDDLKVLDVGCGKAWVMRQWAARFAIAGTGLELNPRFIAEASHYAMRDGVDGRLNFILGRALDYRPEPGGFDIVMCLGATFALGGFVPALEWMVSACRPGGYIVVGDVVLKQTPAVRTGPLPHTTVEGMAIVDRHGAEVSATISASEADFERYASHHRHATLRWARENADRPEATGVLEKSRADWLAYQREIRPHLGWTIYVARREG